MGTKGLTMMINNITELEELAEEISNSSLLAIDTETSGLNWRKDVLSGISIACNPDKGYYIPVNHYDTYSITHSRIVDILSEALSHKPTIVMQNAKFDLRFLSNFGLELENVKDLILYSYLSGLYLKTATQKQTGLKELSKGVFGYDQPSLSQTFRKAGLSAIQENYNTTKLRGRDIAEYACDDAVYTLKLYLEAIKHFDETAFIPRLEFALAPIVKRIEENGFPVNEEFMSDEQKRLQYAADVLEGQVLDKLGNPCGRLSQIKKVAVRIDEIVNGQLPKTNTGQPSINQKAIAKFANEHPAIADYQRWASLISRSRKIKTYIDAIDDGKIHGGYRQIGAVSTGRFSGAEPNLQNVGKAMGKGEDVTYLRKAFIAPEGHYIVEMDFEQIELVLIAYMAGDEKVLNAYYNGVDLHKNTASLMFQVPFDAVTTEQRYIAKTINFAIGFGAGAARVAELAGISVSEAERRVKDWDKVHPKIRSYHQRCANELERNGRVYTLWGRLQRQAKFDNPYTTALNKKVQGSAADIQKVGLIHTHKLVDAEYPLAKCVAQTHDSQTWIIPDEYEPAEIIPKLKDAMNKVTRENESVPEIKVEAQIGRNWNDLQKG